jgi:hypothetical protein
MLWESALNLATEGASFKKTLETKLSGRWNHNMTHLWRARINEYATKGEYSYIELISQVKGQGRVQSATATLFCPFFCGPKGLQKRYCLSTGLIEK